MLGQHRAHMLGAVIKRGVTIPKDAPRFAISMAEQTASKCANGERPQCHIASCLKRFSHNLFKT